MARAIDLALARRQRDEQAQAQSRAASAFLESAKGDPGEPGPAGIDGKPGPAGEPGEKGDKPAHQWRGTALRFEKPDGSWGQFVDLEGPRGPRGGGGSGAGFAPASLPILPDAPRESDYLVLERDGIAYRVSIGSLESIFGRSELTPYSVTVNGEPVTVNTVQVEATP